MATTSPDAIFGANGNAFMRLLFVLSNIPRPVLHSASCLKTCMALRKSDGGGANRSKLYAIQHSMASCLLSLHCNIGGALCVSLFTMTPVPAYNSTETLGIAVAAWYCVNFSPRDVVWVFLSSVPCQTLLFVLTELKRMTLIESGITRASHVYSTSVARFAGGCLNGLGSTYMRSVEELVRTGKFKTAEFTSPTFVTRITVAFTFLYLASLAGLLPWGPDVTSALFAGYVTILGIIRSTTRWKEFDPLLPLAAFFKAVVEAPLSLSARTALKAD